MTKYRKAELIRGRSPMMVIYDDLIISEIDTAQIFSSSSERQKQLNNKENMTEENVNIVIKFLKEHLNMVEAEGGPALNGVHVFMGIDEKVLNLSPQEAASHLDGMIGALEFEAKRQIWTMRKALTAWLAENKIDYKCDPMAFKRTEVRGTKGD